jgi:hypothetical protein
VESAAAPTDAMAIATDTARLVDLLKILLLVVDVYVQYDVCVILGYRSLEILR